MMAWEKKPVPRYNVVTARINDDQLAALEALKGGRSMSALLSELLNEAIISREDAAYRERVFVGG